jgi:hypothetical protein
MESKLQNGLMNKIIKIILINIVVLFSLLIICDLISLTILNSSKILKKYFNNTNVDADFRSTFPVYNNFNWSKTFYEELYKLPFEYRSYYGWRALNFKGKTINLDSNGIRKTIDYHPNVIKNKTIGFFGGSTIWGFGVNDSTTIPSYISKISNGTTNIINYGEQAYRAHQSLQLLEIEFSNKELPDVVIFYDGANNYRPINERLFSTNNESAIIERLKGMDQNINGINSNNAEATQFNKHYLYPTIFLLNKLIKISKIDINKNKLKHDLKSDSLAATELLESWLLAKIYTERRGKRFYCFLQPTFFTSHAKNSEYIKSSINNGIHTNKTYLYYDLLKKMIKSEKYKPLEINFVDLSDQFYNQDNIYIDFCHLGPFGNETIAKKIYNKIKN